MVCKQTAIACPCFFLGRSWPRRPLRRTRFFTSKEQAIITYSMILRVREPKLFLSSPPPFRGRLYQCHDRGNLQNLAAATRKKNNLLKLYHRQTFRKSLRKWSCTNMGYPKTSR